jgi:hypothetical protein
VSRARAYTGHAAAAGLGVLVGAIVMLSTAGISRPERGLGTSASPGEHRETAAPRRTLRPKGIVLAWAPGGLPPETETVLQEMRSVGATTTVYAGVDWIEQTRLPYGAVVDDTEPGFAIPFEVAVVKPVDYAAFVPPSEREAVLALRPGELLLAETAAGLRRARIGMRIELEDRSVRVAGIVSDTATNGYEAITAGPVPSWPRVESFVLAASRAGGAHRIKHRIKKLLPPGGRLRFRLSNEQPFQRYGDAVHPQMIIKKHFGEFAARRVGDGFLEVDPAWRAANLRQERVPILGEVTCNKALFPQLRGALRTVRAEGLAHLIDPSDFGGCFGSRFISSRPGGRLSHHSWGIAIDLNVSENAPGTAPSLDPRVVDAIEKWGFTWGGRWIIPDGMHFEWQRWP